MLNKTNYLIKLCFFWLCFFLFSRILFLVYHYAKIPSQSSSEIIKALYAGIRLDLSMSAYLVAIPFMIWSIKLFLNKHILNKINNWINSALISICSLIILSNIKIYEEWGTIINYRAISFMRYPREVLANLSVQELISGTLAYIAISLLWIFIFFKFFSKINTNYALNPAIKAFLVLLSPGIIVLNIRGGLQVVPINESSAHYSNHQILNHLAVNPIWYLGDNMLKSQNSKNNFIFFDDSTLNKHLETIRLENKPDSTQILNCKTPNVVLIILESYTAQIIEKLGGETLVSPNFNKLCEDGLLFTNIFSSGFRTDQGLAAILSGFPAQPGNSIIKHTEKASQLPNISKKLKKSGYTCSFNYGGEIEFANMNSYLLSADFDKISSVKNYPGVKTSKWGVNDEYVFEKNIQELNTMPQPFFSTILTLSNHEPFEVPCEQFKGEEKEQKFRNSAYYTDLCLNNYFKRAKQQKWYEKTLFIIVADHGHRLPNNKEINSPEGRKIPLLITGGALKKEYRNKTCEKLGNHHDIPAFLFNQLNIDSKEFIWSKNLLNNNSIDFAYFATENGFGWITKENQFNYNHDLKQIDYNINNQTVKDSVLNQGKAYLQGVYRDFLNF